MKKFFNWYSKKITAHPKTFLVSGLTAAVLIIALGFLLGGKLSTKSLSIGSTPADEAAKIVKKHFGNSTSGAQAQIVLRSKTELTSQQNQAQLMQIQKKAAKVANVKTVLSPAVLRNYAQKNRVAYFTLIFKNKTITTKQTNQLKRLADKFRNQQLEVELSGISSKIEVSELPEIIGVAIAFIILTITFASFALAGLPIISAILGLVTGLGGIFYAAKFWNVESYDLALAAMISLAVGIDYALFLVARYREELTKQSKNAAIKQTLITTAPAVLFAATTIIVALLSMSALKIGFLGIMGAVSALSVALVVLLTLIIVPSLLLLLPISLAPKRATTKLRPAKFFAGIVSKRPLIVIIMVLIILFTAAIPVKELNLGLPNDGSKQPNTTERKAYDIKQKAYGAGSDAVLVAVTKNKDSQTAEKLADQVKKLDGVDSIGQPTLSTDQKYVMLSIIPKSAANSPRTQKIVQQVRKIQTEQLKKVMVTGTTAMNIDISAKLMAALPVFLTIIVLFSFGLLLLAFRSLLIPLVAVGGFIGSLLATLGLIVYTVQQGHFAGLLHLPGKTAILNFLPVLVVGILFGLAMDYEVFLVSRIHEEYFKTNNNRQAVNWGLQANGGPILAAALIMIAVFASFSFTDEIIIQMMGLSLAFGVFFDALLVRLLLVPACIRIFGKANWYLPKWLDQILPRLNIK